MVVPLCRMVPMLVVTHAFKINISKMEQAFHMGYKEGDKVFYLCSLSWKGEEQDCFYTMEHGMNTGSLKMSNLRRCYEKTQTWCTSPTRCFLCGTITITSKLGCHT